MNFETNLTEFRNLTIYEILKKLADNVSYNCNNTPNTLWLSDDIDTIKLGSYIVESGYEDYSITYFISLNDEILYSQDSVCVDSYRIKLIDKGKFKNLDDAISYLSDFVKNKKMFLTNKDLSKNNDSLQLM